jgi:hypothetical protein
LQSEVSTEVNPQDKKSKKICKIPVYRGHHICDREMTKIFKNEFSKEFDKPRQGELGHLFENPVITSTELVSQGLSLLKFQEFRNYF